MSPESVLVVLVESVSKLMNDDIITKFFWKSHKLDIETDSISIATASPSWFLMPACHILIRETEVLCELHSTMREIRFCECSKLCELWLCQGSHTLMWLFLFLYPSLMFLNKSPNFSLWNPLWSSNNYLSGRIDTETHTAEPWDTNEGKIFHPITACKRNWKTVQSHTELRDEIDHRARASYLSTYQNSHNYDSSQPEHREIQ